jgi:hypothetical protein
VQTPVHTSAEKYAHLQGGSNPVSAFPCAVRRANGA